MNVKDFLIDEERTIIETMQRLDEVAKKVLFVVRGEVLVAAITDGDIRRWILKKGNLDARVKDVANYSPEYLEENDQDKAKQYIKKYSLEAIPIVNQDMNIIAIIFWNEDEVGIKRQLNVPVVIMAGGLGSRLYPYTKILPKPLIPIGEIPIVEHIINRFYNYGCNDFYLILNHKRNMVKAYFNEIDRNYNINYIDEDKPLGTGGGLNLLKGKINTTFILSNCDILVEEDYEKIYKFHKEEGNLITMVCSLKNIQIPYGVIEINETGEIEEMKEKPVLSFITNTGLYIVEPKIIEELEDDKVLGFPEIIEKYRQEGHKVGVYPISENAWLDMGQPEEMEKMRKRLEEN